MTTNQEKKGNIQLFPDVDDKIARASSDSAESNIEIPSLYRSSSEAIYDDFNPEQTRLGITMTLFSVLVISLSTLMLYVSFTEESFDPAKLSAKNYIFWALGAFVIISFLGLLMKKEWARKTVLVLLIFLKIYPLNWLIGNFLIGKLKNKKFNLTRQLS